MGYSTTFKGRLEFSRELTISELGELKGIVEGRHDDDQFPSIHCDWTSDGRALFWNGSEKSYEMDAWLEILITWFFDEHGVMVNGTVTAQGERADDAWRLVVEDSHVTRQAGRLVFEPTE